MLLYQNGVLMRSDQQVRVVGPGTCWVRPGSKVILCDMRARALQIEDIEILTADNGVVRVNVSGEYKIAEAGLFLNAGDKLYFELRQEIKQLGRSWKAAGLTQDGGAELFAGQLREAMGKLAGSIGLEVLKLDVWEVFLRGYVTPPEAPSTPERVQ